MILFALYVGAYLLGSVPFAVIIGKINGVDILNVGSGNPGMTNVMRALGVGWSIVCFFLDVLKGLLPTLAASKLVTAPVHGLDPQLIWVSVGLAAIVGHCFSVFLRFKGGKGVATALGMIIGASPVVALLCFGLFGVMLVSTQYMSIASVVGVASAIPFCLILRQSPQIQPIMIALTLFVVYKHRKNFMRLQDGTEPKFKFVWRRKPESESDPSVNQEDEDPDKNQEDEDPDI